MWCPQDARRTRPSREEASVAVIRFRRSLRSKCSINCFFYELPQEKSLGMRSGEFDAQNWRASFHSWGRDSFRKLQTLTVPMGRISVLLKKWTVLNLYLFEENPRFQAFPQIQCFPQNRKAHKPSLWQGTEHINLRCGGEGGVFWRPICQQWVYWIKWSIHSYLWVLSNNLR